MAAPTHSPEPPQIFLSYALEDAEMAADFRAALIHEGADVWTPERLNISARTDLGVREAIKRSHLFLLLVTEASLKSDWVDSELQHALGLSDAGEATKIVPLIVGDVPVPEELDRMYSLEVRTSDWKRVAAHLLEASPRLLEIPEADFFSEVRTEIEETGLTWEEESVRGGVRPDFLVQSPDGRRSVIEVKARDDPSLFEALQARTEATRLAAAVGADVGFVVFRSLRELLGHENIVDSKTFRTALLAWAEATEPTKDGPALSDGEEGRGTVFVAMPFSPEYSDVYWVAAVEAAKALGLGCVRVDEVEYAGDVTAKIKSLILESVAVVADVSEARANVMYEAGFAHALNRPSVHICSTPLDELPFDIRNWNTMPYRKGETWRLKEKLEDRLRAVLGA